MNEKPVKLPMSFGEALARLARVPKPLTGPTKKQQRLEKSKQLGHTKTGVTKTRRIAGKRKKGAS